MTLIVHSFVISYIPGQAPPKDSNVSIATTSLTMCHRSLLTLYYQYYQHQQQILTGHHDFSLHQLENMKQDYRHLRYDIQTCQPPENSKREIARNSDVSTKLACNLRARFKTFKISRREIFSSGERFFAAFQKDNTCYWQKKKSIPLAFTDTKPIKQGKIETLSYLRY